MGPMFGWMMRLGRTASGIITPNPPVTPTNLLTYNGDPLTYLGQFLTYTP